MKKTYILSTEVVFEYFSDFKFLSRSTIQTSEILVEDGNEYHWLKWK